MSAWGSGTWGEGGWGFTAFASTVDETATGTDAVAAALSVSASVSETAEPFEPTESPLDTEQSSAPSWLHLGHSQG